MKILCILSIGFWQILFCQSPKIVTDIDVANASYAEKIYLQLDNYAYHNRDTIWFKAIVTDSYLHLPSSKSKVLYVELIDQEEQILEKKILKLKEGTSDGFFELQQSYPGGKYLIRAYTRWNMNFNDDFIFSAYIDVFDFDLSDIHQKPIRNIVQTETGDGTLRILADIFPEVLDSLRATKSVLYLDWGEGVDSVAIKKTGSDPFRFVYDFPKTTQIIRLNLTSASRKYRESILLKKDDLDVRFFPEGGNLVNGLESNLGIKVLDKNGKGQRISGHIFDDLGNRLVDFETNTLGMGKVAFTPDISKTYSAKVSLGKELDKTFPLPKIFAKGDVLSVTEDNHRVKVKITSNHKQNDSLTIQIKYRGVPKHTIKTKFQNGTCMQYINKSVLPWGIIEITLLDQNARPTSERLWLVDNKRQKLTIKAFTEYDSYKTREKVRMDLHTADMSGPKSSNLSVTVVDKAYYKSLNVERPNILSYFLLQSELRGDIENPTYYFQENMDSKDLDALLLTQGWRRYKYDKAEQAHPIAPEKGLSISGWVDGVNNKRHRKKPELTLMTFGETSQVFQPSVDGTGRFNLELPDSFGHGVPFVAQMRDERGKDKGFSIHIPTEETPKVEYDHQKNAIPVDSLVKKRIVETIKVVKRSDPFSIPENTIALDEVVLTDYALTPEREAMKDLHGLPNLVIDDKTLMKKMKDWTGFLYPWLHFNMPEEIEVRTIGGSMKIVNVLGSDFTYVIVDGKPVFIERYYLLQSLRVPSIKSVEIIRNPVTAHGYVSQVFPDVSPYEILTSMPRASILAIYTHSGSGLSEALGEQKHLFNDILPQYSPVKEFYAPDYSKMEGDTIENTDLRKLLFWKPDLQTNEEGEARLEFFNGDLPGTKLIIIEGIDADGNLGYKEIMYRVVEDKSP
ncbi:hypothetical protein [Ulvibacterium sp.]|uniref:hypothetical protein n=1 Tax=Ulvibacterium sp. TaxID=2665914 RepID=UPI003BAB1BD7